MNGFATYHLLMSALYDLLFADRFQTLRLRCALALYLLVLFLGSLPGARAEVGVFASGLVLHSGTYAVLTFLLFSGGPGRPARRAVKAVAAIALMGALDEFVQGFFSYRTAAVSDWLVDCSAALVSAGLLWAFWPEQKRAPGM